MMCDMKSAGRTVWKEEDQHYQVGTKSSNTGTHGWRYILKSQHSYLKPIVF